MLRGIKKRFKKGSVDEVDPESAVLETTDVDTDELLDDEDWDDFEDEEEEKLPFKQRFLKGLRTAAISMLVLLVLAGGAGVAYSWYVGEHTTASDAAIAKPVEAPKRAEIKPTAPRPDSAIGASVQMLTTPVAPGENASMTVKTLATAVCKISVEYNKVPSKDSGLVEHTADEFGIVMWSWTVDANAPYGTWPVNVTCTFNKRSAFVRGDMTVAKPDPATATQ